MEIGKNSKSIRRGAAALTLIVALALLTLGPSIGAKYVAGMSGLVGEPRTDLDNLFINIMNESLPVGSIYMTTNPALSTADDMEAHFGGKWLAWGQGRVPVGVDFIADSPFEALGTGGAVNPGQSKAVPLTFAVTGSIGLTGGGTLTYSDSGVTLGVNVGLSGSQTFSGAWKMQLANLPAHNHAAEMWHSGRDRQAGNCGSAMQIADSGGATHARYVQGAATNPLSAGWRLEIRDEGIADASQPTQYTDTIIDFSSGYTASVNLPAQSYTKPTARHNPQAVTGISALTASANATVSWTDNTIQPYVTCYMYKRTELAKLAPLA